MEWSDDGTVIGVKRHGERGLIVEALTGQHGRHLGLVRGGAAPRHQAALQPGNDVKLVWRARLADHLGNFAIDPAKSRTADILGDRQALAGLAMVTSLARLLPERDPHPGIHAALGVVLDNLHRPVLAAALIVRFELALLTELGFGLDLATCAATGLREGLAFVSPKTGRAISAAAGEPWRGRLFELPAFLSGQASNSTPTLAQIAAGFRLTGFFLERHVYQPRGLIAPDARARFIAALPVENAAGQAS